MLSYMEKWEKYTTSFFPCQIEPPSDAKDPLNGLAQYGLGNGHVLVAGGVGTGFDGRALGVGLGDLALQRPQGDLLGVDVQPGLFSCFHGVTLKLALPQLLP